MTKDDGPYHIIIAAMYIFLFQPYIKWPDVEEVLTTAPEKSAQYGCERVAIADRMHCDRQKSHRGFHIFASRLASQCDADLQVTSKWEWPDRFTDKGLVDVVSNF